MQIKLATVSLLGVAILTTGLGVVNATHQNRQAFIQLQSLLKQRDQMEIEWGQLQLEQATWATHGRVEELAHDKLNMLIPTMESVVLITP